MPVSRLDVIYRKLLLSKMFTKGWGKPDDLQRLFNFRKIISDRDKCVKLIPQDHEITITNTQIHADFQIMEGRFRSPFAIQLPGIVPHEVQDAVFQMILPLKWPNDDFKPVCIHLASTGDHFFWRRRHLMVKPLIKAGIGAIILENPYYGFRKPKKQIKSSVRYVSDIFVMGGCLILEGLVLLNWCEKLGLGPLGVTGISMGGHMASLVASNWPKPLVLVPCLSWSTASSVFTEGVMSDSIDWDMLQKQYFSDKLYCEELSKMCKIVDDPFACSLIKSLTAREALWFMRGIMDECTHLRNFSVPVDTSLIISVTAKIDGYVPRKGVSSLDLIWPGATVKYINCGHVGACIWYRHMFRDAIIEAFNRAQKKT